MSSVYCAALLPTMPVSLQAKSYKKSEMINEKTHQARELREEFWRWYKGFVVKVWPEILYWCLVFLKLLKAVTAELHFILWHLCTRLEEYQRTVAQNVVQNILPVSSLLQNCRTLQNVSLIIVNLPGNAHHILNSQRTFYLSTVPMMARRHFGPRVWYFALLLVQELESRSSEDISGGCVSESELCYVIELQNMKRRLLRLLESTASGVLLHIFLYHRRCFGKCKKMTSIVTLEESQHSENSETTKPPEESSINSGEDVTMHQLDVFGVELAKVRSTAESSCDLLSSNVSGLQDESCNKDMLYERTVCAAPNECDVADASAASDIVVVSSASDIVNASSASDIVDESAASEIVDESAASEIVDESAASDIVDESAASDIVDESATSDIVDESAASDIVDESAVSDIVDESAVSDIVDESAASDIVDESATSDIVDESAASDIVDESAVSDIVDESAVSDIVDESVASDIVDESAAGDIVDESSAGDIVDALAATDITDTSTTSDITCDSAASDVVDASTAGDIVNFSAASVIIDSSSASDSVDSSPASDSVDSSPASDSVDSSPASDSVDSSPASDSVDSSPASDSVDSSPASDSVDSSPASDSVDSSPASDSVDSSPASDSVNASATSNKLEVSISDNKNKLDIRGIQDASTDVSDIQYVAYVGASDASSVQDGSVNEPLIGDVHYASEVRKVQNASLEVPVASDVNDAIKASCVHNLQDASVSDKSYFGCGQNESDVDVQDALAFLDVSDKTASNDVKNNTYVIGIPFASDVNYMHEGPDISGAQAVHAGDLLSSSICNTKDTLDVDIPKTPECIDVSSSPDVGDFQTECVENELLNINLGTNEMKQVSENELQQMRFGKPDYIETMINIYLNDLEILKIPEELPEHIFDSDEDVFDFGLQHFPERILLDDDSFDTQKIFSFDDFKTSTKLEPGENIIGASVHVVPNEESKQILDKQIVHETLRAPDFESLQTPHDLCDVLRNYEFVVSDVVPVPTIKEENDVAAELDVNSESNSKKLTDTMEPEVYNPYNLLNYANNSKEIDQQYEISKRQSNTTKQSEIYKILSYRGVDWDDFSKEHSLSKYFVEILEYSPSWDSFRVSKSTVVPSDRLVIEVGDEKALSLLKPTGNYPDNEEDEFKILIHFALMGEIAVSAKESHWLGCCEEYAKRLGRKDQPLYKSLFLCILKFLLDFCNDNFGIRKQDYEIAFYSPLIEKTVSDRHFAVGFDRIVDGYPVDHTQKSNLESHPGLPSHLRSFSPFHMWELQCPDSSIVPYYTWESPSPTNNLTTIDSSDQNSKSDGETWLFKLGSPKKTFVHPPMENLFATAFKHQILYFSLPENMQRCLKGVHRNSQDSDIVTVIYPVLTPQEVLESAGYIFIFCNFWQQRVLRDLVGPNEFRQVSIERSFSHYKKSVARPKRTKTFIPTSRKLKLQQERTALVGRDVKIGPVDQVADEHPDERFHSLPKGSNVDKKGNLDFETLLSNFKMFQRWKEDNPNSLISLGQVILTEDRKTPVMFNADENIDVKQLIRQNERIRIKEAVVLARSKFSKQVENGDDMKMILKEIERTQQIITSMIGKDWNVAKREENISGNRWVIDGVTVEISRNVYAQSGENKNIEIKQRIEVDNKNVLNKGRRRKNMKKWSTQNVLSRDAAYRMRLKESLKEGNRTLKLDPVLNENNANSVVKEAEIKPTNASDNKDSTIQVSHADNESDFRVQHAIDNEEAGVTKASSDKETGSNTTHKSNKKTAGNKKRKKKKNKCHVEQTSNNTEKVCNETDVSKKVDVEAECQINQKSVKDTDCQMKLKKKDIDEQEKQTIDSVEPSCEENVCKDIDLKATDVDQKSEFQVKVTSNDKGIEYQVIKGNKDIDCQVKQTLSKDTTCTENDVSNTCANKEEVPNTHNDMDCQIKQTNDRNEIECTLNEANNATETHVKQEMVKNKCLNWRKQNCNYYRKPQNSGMVSNRHWHSHVNVTNKYNFSNRGRNTSEGSGNNWRNGETVSQSGHKNHNENLNWRQPKPFERQSNTGYLNRNFKRPSAQTSAVELEPRESPNGAKDPNFQKQFPTYADILKNSGAKIQHRTKISNITRLRKETKVKNAKDQISQIAKGQNSAGSSLIKTVVTESAQQTESELNSSITNETFYLQDVLGHNAEYWNTKERVIKISTDQTSQTEKEKNISDCSSIESGEVNEAVKPKTMQSSETKENSSIAYVTLRNLLKESEQNDGYIAGFSEEYIIKNSTDQTSQTDEKKKTVESSVIGNCEVKEAVGSKLVVPIETKPHSSVPDLTLNNLPFPESVQYMNKRDTASPVSGRKSPNHRQGLTVAQRLSQQFAPSVEMVHEENPHSRASKTPLTQEIKISPTKTSLGKPSLESAEVSKERVVPETKTDIPEVKLLTDTQSDSNNPEAVSKNIGVKRIERTNPRYIGNVPSEELMEEVKRKIQQLQQRPLTDSDSDSSSSSSDYPDPIRDLDIPTDRSLLHAEVLRRLREK